VRFSTGRSGIENSVFGFGHHITWYVKKGWTNHVIWWQNPKRTRPSFFSPIFTPILKFSAKKKIRFQILFYFIRSYQAWYQVILSNMLVSRFHGAYPINIKQTQKLFGLNYYESNGSNRSLWYNGWAWVAGKSKNRQNINFGNFQSGSLSSRNYTTRCPGRKWNYILLYFREIYIFEFDF